MLNDLLNSVSELVRTNVWLAFPAVFLGGFLTAANPCVLAMVPLMMGFVGGTREATSVKMALLYSLCFVMGLSITFAVLGVIAASMGRLLGDIGGYWPYVVAGVCILMGLHLMEVFSFSISLPGNFRVKQAGLIGALLLGLLFGVVSSPCATPILAIVLTYVASRGSSLLYGGALLLVYALGHSVLILAAGTSVGFAKGFLESKGLTRATSRLRKGAGGLIVLVGVYILMVA